MRRLNSETLICRSMFDEFLYRNFIIWMQNIYERIHMILDSVYRVRHPHRNGANRLYIVLTHHLRNMVLRRIETYIHKLRVYTRLSDVKQSHANTMHVMNPTSKGNKRIELAYGCTASSLHARPWT